MFRTTARRLSLALLLTPAGFAPQPIQRFQLANTRQIALTIDDGPGPSTGPILALLKEHHIKASFFLIGANVQRFPGLVQRIADEGHVIGNHTFHHRMLLHTDPRVRGWVCEHDDVVEDEIRATHDLLQRFIPASQKHLYFRPPGGGWCERFSVRMNRDPDFAAYVGPVYWTLGGSLWRDSPNAALKDASDEECWTTGVPLTECLKGYRAAVDRLRGGVMLVHDVHPMSVELLKILIPELKAKGYRFITLDEIPWATLTSADKGP